MKIILMLIVQDLVISFWLAILLTKKYYSVSIISKKIIKFADTEDYY